MKRGTLLALSVWLCLSPLCVSAHESLPARVIASLIHSCASSTNPQTLAAIIEIESGAWPWTIGDNTAGQSYYEPTYTEAATVARYLYDHGHNLDLGLAQVNTVHLPTMGISVEQALTPCTNLSMSQEVLMGDWHTAIRHFGVNAARAEPSSILLYAISAYNTGSLFAGGHYVSMVVQATTGHFVQQVVRYSTAAPAPRAPRPPSRASINRGLRRYFDTGWPPPGALL